jgi:hypothetical protein
LSFDLDFGKILEVINKHYNSRSETVDAYKTLNQYLSNIKRGFLVYTNAKDYSLIKNKQENGYSFSGFSAGSAITLEKLEHIISNTPGGS